MAFVHGKTVALLVDDADLSSVHNDLSFPITVETAETTTFGKTDKTYIAGLGDGTISASGLFDAVASDAILVAKLKSASARLVTACLGPLVLGTRCRIGAVVKTSYEVSASVGDAVAFSSEYQVTDGGDGGSIHAAARNLPNTSTVNETGQDNGASSANGGVAAIHVTANDRNGTTVVKVQHSVDNVSYVDLVTFATLLASTKSYERVVVAPGTTVNRYTRATGTAGGTTGSVTYSVAFARR